MESTAQGHWNSGDSLPEVAGMYERDTSEVGEVSDIVYSYFDGEYWHIGDDSPNTPVSSTPSGHQNLRWRKLSD